jgi:hypothetical protein
MISTTINEAGIHFWRPCDGNWIPEGFETVDLEVDAELWEDDQSVALEEAAEAWLAANRPGSTLFEVILV